MVAEQPYRYGRLQPSNQKLLHRLMSFIVRRQPSEWSRKLHPDLPLSYVGLVRVESEELLVVVSLMESLHIFFLSSPFAKLQSLDNDFAALRTFEENCQFLLFLPRRDHRIARRQSDVWEFLKDTNDQIGCFHQCKVLCHSVNLFPLCQIANQIWNYLLPRHSRGPPWKGRYAHPISASLGPSHRSGRYSIASSP